MFVIMLLMAILVVIAILGIISYTWNHLAMVPCICSEFTSLDWIASMISAYNHLKDKHQFPEGLKANLLVLDKKCQR